MTVNVLVVDDSAFMRKVLSEILNSDKEINVVGTAINGEDALDKISKLNPDVITMDINMPKLDGISTLKRIMSENPKPVIMVSAQDPKDSKNAIDALEIGAIDFVVKPSGEISLNMKDLQDEVIEKVKAAAKAILQKVEKKEVMHRSFAGAVKKIIAIGSSTGGPQTLEQIIPTLPKNIPACVIVVQHMPPLFTKSLAERFARISEVPVVEAKDGDEVKEGIVYIAPGDYHLEVKRIFIGETPKDVIKLNQKPKELGVRPNVNVMMRSIAEIYKEKVVGIVLTGMGSDGTDGAMAIKKNGGTVLVQDKDSSIIYGMPKSVFESGYYDEVVELSKIPVALVQLLEL